MKRLTLLLAMAALPGLSAAAPLVNFNGEVATVTCQVTVNGETNPIVLLPTVKVADFEGPGSSPYGGAQTLFTIEGSHCTVSAEAYTVRPKFLGHHVTAAGNLSNLAGSNAAGDVAVQLVGYQLNEGVATVSGIAADVAPGSDSFSITMGVRYVTEGGSPTVGKVTAVTEYVFEYL
ncbi:fimbrial protein [Stutzerimonas stutzeri]|uniref:Fimbrial protein n=1 Tax=Stutzerimonas stutzeri TaxID=316 RepID=A0A6I6LJF8_STUST|nr:fimbrial protein [Stutzerimonas stutzeri]QGZ29373.1 fimbrial protein [Stutzerimonas stutzeri]